jgi:uncharacterized membrane protein YdjX (TVP38/TMEM64 family)
MVYILTFFGIVLLNAIPFFAPTTWTVLLLVAALTDLNPWYLPFIGAVAASIGRVILALGARTIMRTHFLSAETRGHIDAVRDYLKDRRALASGMFFLYALGPLPTNYLFIAYGLTTLHLRYILLPFFVGRLASYAFWTYIGTTLGTLYVPVGWQDLFTGYAILGQFTTIAALYAFVKIPWRRYLPRLHRKH